MTVSDAQVWTVVGVLATALFGVIGALTWSVTRQTGMVMQVVRAEVGGLHARVDAVVEQMRVGFASLERRMDGLERRMDGLEHRMDRLETRIDGLDRDVTWLMRRAVEDDGSA